MSWRKPLLRLTLAVTLVVTAVGLAPAVADAHAGHDHKASPAVGSVTIVERGDAKETSAPRSEEKAGISTSRAETTASFPGLGPDGPKSCPDGCCQSGGHACCGVWFSAPPEVFVPTLVRLTPLLSDGGGPGISPAALPEPPDALV